MKLNPKMGFWRAKHGLKRPKFGLQREKRTNREGRRGEEEEEEKKRKKEDSNQDQAKVWKLNLSMDLWNFKGFIWLIACLQKLGF